MRSNCPSRMQLSQESSRDPITGPADARGDITEPQADQIIEKSASRMSTGNCYCRAKESPTLNLLAVRSKDARFK